MGQQAWQRRLYLRLARHRFLCRVGNITQWDGSHVVLSDGYALWRYDYALWRYDGVAAAPILISGWHAALLFDQHEVILVDRVQCDSILPEPEVAGILPVQDERASVSVAC